ncbi:MAG: hypothetical protein ABIH66_09275, partial [bacterium]
GANLVVDGGFAVVSILKRVREMIRIGIIGAGCMAEVHIDAFRKAGACEIVGVTGANLVVDGGFAVVSI